MAEHDVIILRLGYRLGRDPRITTHLALVARALGANRFLFSGDEDERLPENIASVNQRLMNLRFSIGKTLDFLLGSFGCSHFMYSCTYSWQAYK